MLLKNDVVVHPTNDIFFLAGAVPLEHNKVALITSRQQQVITDILFYEKDKLLHTQTYNQQILQFGTINRFELFVLLPNSGEWAIIDSNTFKETRGKFEFRRKSACRAHVLFFPESKRICIYESGEFGDKAGRFTFMMYPPTEDHSETWEVPLANGFNLYVAPLNLRNRLVFFEDRVKENDKKIRFSVVDIDRKAVKQVEINTQECLKNVYEIQEGDYLLMIEAMNPEFRYMIYSDSAPGETRAFKAQFSDKTYDILAIGGWLYALEFDVDNNGVSQIAPLRVVSKDTEQQVFTDKCQVSGAEYSLGTTSQRFIVRVETEHIRPKQVKIETLRATSQRELYVHLFKQLSQHKVTVDMVNYVLDSFEDTYL